MKQKLQAREVLQTWSNLNLEEKYVIYTNTAHKKKKNNILFLEPYNKYIF
jgi:hypothetical protein